MMSLSCIATFCSEFFRFFFFFFYFSAATNGKRWRCPKEKVAKGRTIKEGKNSVGKKGVGPSLFHSRFVFPFVHFSYGQCQCCSFVAALKRANAVPRWQPRTTLYKFKLKSILIPFFRFPRIAETNPISGEIYTRSNSPFALEYPI
jgi:hypothetical protein